MTPSDRKLGLAAGLLLGDALGAPFQSVKAGHIQQLAGGRVDAFLADPVHSPDKPERNCLPGLHSAVGQVALAVLAGGADDATGRHPLARAAAALVELAGTDEPQPAVRSALRKPGKPLQHALDRWAADYPWDLDDHLARDEDSCGAGGCVAAVAGRALAEPVDPLAAARLTHLREPALVGAWILARLADRLMAAQNSRRVSPDTLLAGLAAEARQFEDDLRAGPVGERWRELEWGYPRARMSDALSTVASLLKVGDDALAEKSIIGLAEPFEPSRPVAQVQHGFAPVLVPWVALGDLSPMNALEDAINRGGETPLAAALIGGLLGARWGIGHFAEELLGALLAGRVLRALATEPTPAAVEAWQADERTWTGREQALRAPLLAAAEKARAEHASKHKPKPKPVELPEQGELPFAPPPHAWLTQKGDELAPWEKNRLKSERGRKRLDWQEEQRAKKKLEGGGE
jgi:ADP-ribosylglycohydrolase